MLGYVLPDKGELKVKEFEIYSSYYCGLCKAAGARHGQIPRLVLSYDFVFLAMLMAAISETTDKIEEFRCFVHPAKKRNYLLRTSEIDYAADMMILLGYHNLKDDFQDEKSPVGLIGKTALSGAYKKINVNLSEKSRVISERLAELGKLEKENCSSLDQVAEPFAKLMEELMDFQDYIQVQEQNQQVQRQNKQAQEQNQQVQEQNQVQNKHAESLRYAYRRIGYHLGKWIYLIDAFDDIEKDVKSGSYNPLIRQFSFDTGENEGEDISSFRNRIRDSVKLNIMLYLSSIAEVFELLPVKKNKNILENIIYVGLLRRTDEVLLAHDDDKRKNEERQ